MTALPEPTDPPYRRDPRGGSPADDDPRRCTATNRTTGERCRGWAIQGGTVCQFHGGRAPQVKRKAQLRLLDMIPIATKRHKEILTNSKDERVVLQATKMVYDRVGLEEGSASADVEVVREMVASKLIDMISGVYSSPDTEEADDSNEDIVDAELVDDEESKPEGWDLI